MDSRNIVDELLNLINSAETKNEEKFSFGLFYEYSLRNEIHILTVEIRQEINNRAEEEKKIYDEKFEETSQIHEIHFNTIYELIKYIMWIKYKIEIFRKLALVFSTVPLAVIGFCLSLGHHRISKKYSFILAMIIVFAYIIFLNVGIVMATAGKLNPFIATWTPNVLLYLLGYKLYKAKEVRGI